MQEKKNKRLFILLIVLVGITLVLYAMRIQKKEIVDPLVFKNVDLTTIDQVILQSASGTVDLRAESSRWQVNEKYIADRNMIDVLFATLQQAQPKRPLSGAYRDSVGKVLEREGVKVSLLSKKDVVLDFYCGGNSQKTIAFFKKAGDEEIYLMNIPGYRVYVSGIFELPESGWRDKYVFGFNWRNFKKLDASFADRKNNFTVQMDDAYFGITGIEAVDTTRLNDYLDAVSLLTVDDYVQDTTGLSELRNKEPFLTLAVEDIASRKYSLQVYPSDRPGSFFGWMNQSDWVIIAGNKIADVRYPRSFFIAQKPE